MDYTNGTISPEIFCDILSVIENYAFRRFVCGIPTNQLNKIFPVVYRQSKQFLNEPYVNRLKRVLQSKNYPKNGELRNYLKSVKLYGAGRDKFGRVVLERIERSFGHKEPALLESLQIEHIMVQTLTSEWEIHLGEDYAQTHEVYLHTLGNLTLTGYNQDLSNFNFQKKKVIYRESHLEMNKYFESVERWNEDEIITRAENLAEIIIEKVYPYFGEVSDISGTSGEITGSKPSSLQILGDTFTCSSWHEVLSTTLKVFSELEPEKLETLSQECPSLIGKQNTFRRGKELANGYWYEANLSAKSIYNYCLQVMSSLGLDEGEWHVAYDAKD